MKTWARYRDRGGGSVWEQGGWGVYPNERGTRISTSSKGGPRRRRISIFRESERENIGEEERGGVIRKKG